MIDLNPQWVDEPKTSASEEDVREESIRIFPDMTPEETQRFQGALDAKQHAEYLCYMMLDALHRTVPLQEMMKDSLRRGTASEEIITEFFGDSEADENAGCPAAEGYTIPGLLEHWRQCTDTMLRTISEAGRNKS